MSSNAPDFSAAFDMAGHALEDIEKRLAMKRSQAEKKTTEVSKPKVAKVAKVEVEDDKDQSGQEPDPAPRKRPKQAKPDIHLVTKQHRTNLTLKVLAENEARFNELFFRLQLKGDGRKKQDLADEALELLFAKYSQVLR